MSDNNDTDLKKSYSKNGNVNFRNTKMQPDTVNENPTKGKNQEKRVVRAKGRKRPSLLLNIAAMIIVTAVLMLLTGVGLNIYTRHGEEIIVPDVKGISVQNAVNKLEMSGLTPIADDSVYVKSLAPGVVFDQSVRAGNTVKAGRLIHLTVNSGTPPQLTLPDIADNSSLREASMKLKAMGFKLGETEYVRGEKDWVYGVKCDGRNISTGSRINADKTLTLVVGDGTYFDNDIRETEISDNFDSLFMESSSNNIPK